MCWHRHKNTSENISIPRNEATQLLRPTYLDLSQSPFFLHLPHLHQHSLLTLFLQHILNPNSSYCLSHHTIIFHMSYSNTLKTASSLSLSPFGREQQTWCSQHVYDQSLQWLFTFTVQSKVLTLLCWSWPSAPATVPSVLWSGHFDLLDVPQIKKTLTPGFCSCALPF